MKKISKQIIKETSEFTIYIIGLFIICGYIVYLNYVLGLRYLLWGIIPISSLIYLYVKTG